ncbi:DET1-and DDB1-associated protein 1 [Trichonephila clavipes]|nr:DET1-and DDB1-associated protein 1 [Trichonephila clavipes]GFX30000.1 DET1-and DDB1-associated protein 1 [Trichonephila clavipes]
MAGTEKFCKLKMNSSSASVPYSQLLDLRSSQNLSLRASSETTAEFLKALPSRNESNFSRYQPDASCKASMKKTSVYLPTKDHPSEQTLLPKRLQARLFFKAGTDESHLVQDQDWDIGTPNQELQFLFCIAIAECGLVLSSNNKTPDLRSPDRFFRIASFNFNRVSQYRVALMVPTSKSPSKSKCFFSMQSPEFFLEGFL